MATDCCEIKKKIIESVCSVLQHKHQFTSRQLNQVLYDSDSLRRGIQIQVTFLSTLKY